jgi:hypothetical protein
MNEVLHSSLGASANMSMTIEATYENGHLKLDAPLPFAEK